MASTEVGRALPGLQMASTEVGRALPERQMASTEVGRALPGPQEPSPEVGRALPGLQAVFPLALGEACKIRMFIIVLYLFSKNLRAMIVKNLQIIARLQSV